MGLGSLRLDNPTLDYNKACHGVSCHLDLFLWFHTFLLGFEQSTRNLENNLLSWGIQRINWPLWSPRCLSWDWCQCVFQVLPCCISAMISPIWLPHWQRFEGQVCYQRCNCAILTLGTVMACMMFVWDYILTFGMEVDLIWKSKWSFMKGLYLFQRYLPFTDIIWLVLTGQSDHYVVTDLPMLIFL